jgi:hypothetical protein
VRAAIITGQSRVAAAVEYDRLIQIHAAASDLLVLHAFPLRNPLIAYGFIKTSRTRKQATLQHIVVCSSFTLSLHLAEPSYEWWCRLDSAARPQLSVCHSSCWCSRPCKQQCGFPTFSVFDIWAVAQNQFRFSSRATRAKSWATRQCPGLPMPGYGPGASVCLKTAAYRNITHTETDCNTPQYTATHLSVAVYCGVGYIAVCCGILRTPGA